MNHTRFGSRFRGTGPGVAKRIAVRSALSKDLEREIPIIRKRIEEAAGPGVLHFQTPWDELFIELAEDEPGDASLFGPRFFVAGENAAKPEAGLHATPCVLRLGDWAMITGTGSAEKENDQRHSWTVDIDPRSTGRGGLTSARGKGAVLTFLHAESTGILIVRSTVSDENGQIGQAFVVIGVI